jgi:RimJ/RimL family protein N-acetyltransferase
MLTQTQGISLSQGLNRQDLNIDIILRFWNELQISSADAAQAPMPDLFSFAHTAVFLAVIMQEQKPHVQGNAQTDNQPRWTTAPAASHPFLATGGFARDAESDNAYNQHGSYDWQIKQTTSDLEAQTPIGLLYLTSTPHHNAPAGDLNIGIVLDAASRGRGYARQAVALVLAWVFEDAKFHRVQAAVLDSPEMPRALSLFTKMGFGHEGTRRRSVFSPAEGAWKDATYLAMLDTEWMMRAFYTPAPKSLWDEMFARHHREREELLRWDATKSKLQRMSSAETLRNAAPTPDPGPSRSSTSSPDSAPSDVLPLLKDKGKRKRGVSDEVLAPWDDRAVSPPPSSEASDASASDESDFDSPGPVRVQRTAGVSDVALARRFAVDPFQDDARSSSPEGSVGSADSRWDMIETSSTSSSSFKFEALGDSDVEI